MLKVLSERVEDLPSEPLQSESMHFKDIFHLFSIWQETSLQQLVLSGNNNQAYTMQFLEREKKNHMLLLLVTRS